MADWEFEHSFYTEAKRMDAWNYWSDVNSHGKIEPRVKRIELTRVYYWVNKINIVVKL